MALYTIEESTLKNLANAIRKVNGETKSYTPEEMIDKVTNIMESATYILVDDSGNEIPAVYVDSEAILTATPNDIRIGTVAVTDEGVTEGEKEIPAYYVREGYRIIPNGSKFVLTIRDYDYKKLQAVFCVESTNLLNSVSVDRVALNDNVYPVQSTTAETTITKDHSNGGIDFGITNTSGKNYLIRYFSYTEVY